MKEKETGLQTDKIKIVIFSDKDLLLSNIQFWLFSAIFILIVLIFVGLIFYANSVANDYELTQQQSESKNNFQEEKVLPTSEKIEENPNILSQSILSWNHQMMSHNKMKMQKFESVLENNNDEFSKMNETEKNLVHLDRKEIKERNFVSV